MGGVWWLRSVLEEKKKRWLIKQEKGEVWPCGAKEENGICLRPRWPLKKSGKGIFRRLFKAMKSWRAPAAILVELTSP
jgi:hypothetical protein